MAEMERIELRKIYILRATMFGLLFGLFLGIVLGLLVYFVGVASIPDSITIADKQFQTDIVTSAWFVVSLLFAFVFFVGFFFASVIGALFYNLIAKIGGRIDLGLKEHEAEQQPVT